MSLLEKTGGEADTNSTPGAGGGDAAPRISACVVCRNEGDRLAACLAALQWVDEIVVLDLSSTDDSAEVAERHGARVLRRAPVPVVEWVRNEVAAAAEAEWILVVDPDERITPGLAAELRRAAGEERFDAVVVPRMNFDLGYPPSSPVHRYEPQLRMYRRSRVGWPTVPNALPDVPAERTYRVPPRDELVLVHDRSRNVPEAIERVLRYAPAQARSMVDRGEVFTAPKMFRALARAAYKEFVLARAWRDGVPGMLRASLLVAFKLYLWASFWQLSGVGRTTADDCFVRRLGTGMEAVRLSWSAVRGARRALLRPFRRGTGTP